MNRPKSSVKGKPIGENKVKARNDYLISYNAVSAILWSSVLSLVLGTAITKGIDNVFDHAANFTRMVQSLAVLEIIQSATGTQYTSHNVTLHQH
jgi:very-long-chain (3R)-3-hydroxyacyl-CoA dehydratase